MATLTYFNFDLEFERIEGGFRVDARGPDGLHSANIQIPFTNTELENLVLRIGRSRHAMRRVDPPEIEAAKRFGNRLYQAVFTREIDASFRRSLDLAAQEQGGLRVRVRLTRTPELTNLPWEYLYDQTSNRFLALSVETPLVRYLDIPERIRPLAVELPLRALAIIANPRGQVALDIEREWANIQAASRDLTQRGALVLDRLERATLAALQRRLRQTPYHILHFVGHGAFDQHMQDGVLMLEDSQGDSYRVSGQELGMLLHDHRSLRLVLLNVCEGGRSATDDPFAGVAQSLVQQGIPAVIAMQFEVSDEAAIALAHEFYSAITDNYPVDAALSEARKSVFAQGYRLEWGTPVLYLRAPDGQIFETGAQQAHNRGAPDAALEQRVEELYTQALALYYAERWEGAGAVLEELLAIDPTHSDAAAKLREVQREQQLAASYDRGKQAFDAQNWDQAITHLQLVAATDLDYQETAALLQAAQQRKQIASLYAEARALSDAQSWGAVLSTFDQISELDPSFTDSAGLAHAARAALDQEQRSARLAALYNQAIRHMREERWQEALARLQEIERLQPDYEETPALIARAHAELGTRRRAQEAQPEQAARSLAIPWVTDRAASLPIVALVLVGLAINLIGGHVSVTTRAFPLHLDTVGTILVGALLGPWFGLAVGLLSHVIWTLTGLPSGGFAIWFAYATAVVGLLAGFAGRAGLFARRAPHWLAAIIGAIGFVGLTYCVLVMLAGPYDPDGGTGVFPRLVDLTAEQPLPLAVASAIGAVVGYLRLQRIGYVGLAGLLTGVITATLTAPMVIYLNIGPDHWRPEFIAELFGAISAQVGRLILASGAISDPLDKFVSFLLTWAILQVVPRRLLSSFPQGQINTGSEEAVTAPDLGRPLDR